MLTLKLIDDNPITAQAFFDLTDNNRAYLRQWLPWLDLVNSVDDTQNTLNMRVLSDKAGTTINCFMMINSAIVGIIDVREIKDSQSELGVIAMVGYWIAKEHSGKGHTTTALKAMSKLCKQKGIDTLILRANPDNVGSNKVAINAGFIYQRTDKNASELYGKKIDLNIYQLTL